MGVNMEENLSCENQHMQQVLSSGGLAVQSSIQMLSLF